MESLAMPEKYAVRTLFITNYLSAAHDMAELRRNPTDTQALINAMKRVEIADRTLEAELNSIAEKAIAYKQRSCTRKKIMCMIY
jgi:hypothetical protein